MGCSKPVDIEKAGKDLTASLEKLAAGDGPNFKYVNKYVLKIF